MNGNPGQARTRPLDYFALLHQPRRPGLDDERLKQQFLALSADAHPDRFHASDPEEKARATQRFAELNAAFNCLKEPRDRVRHLVELELGRRPGDLRNVPELADAFMRIAAASRDTDRFAAERSRIHSPLLQAEFFEKIQPHLAALEQLQRELAGLHERALVRLRTLDEAWQKASAADREPVLRQLEELAQVLGFHGRWQAQLQEAHLRLTL